MKFSAVFLAAVAIAEDNDRKVPPRHPLQRLNQLNIFAAEWCNANLNAKAAGHWVGKFKRNTDRFERRWEICGFDDEYSENGGPRERREVDDLAFLDCEGELCPRYDKNNAVNGIHQITKGFARWATRYVAECRKQPETQVNRSFQWFSILAGKVGNQE